MASQGQTASPQPAKDTSILGIEYPCAIKTGSSLTVEDVTVLGFTVGTSTISEIRKRFPHAELVKLTNEEESENGLCVKNREGMAVVFATGIMAAPDTIDSIYLAPARLVEGQRLKCQFVDIPSEMLKTRNGIRVGITSSELSNKIRSGFSNDGPFCTSCEIESGRGPLKLCKGCRTPSHDFTKAEGHMVAGKLEWIKLFGIASD